MFLRSSIGFWTKSPEIALRFQRGALRAFYRHRSPKSAKGRLAQGDLGSIFRQRGETRSPLRARRLRKRRNLLLRDPGNEIDLPGHQIGGNHGQFLHELQQRSDLVRLAVPLGRFSVATMLAGEALAAKGNGEAGGDPQRYVTLARFFAENITVQAGSLEKTVTDSADAVNGADAVLLG